MSLPRLLALALALLALGGCGHFRRVAECRRLAERVNGALDEIAAAQDAGGTTAASYRGIADRYDRLGKDIETFTKEDDTFGRTLKEYGAFYHETSHNLRVLADALDRRDYATVARLRRDAAPLMRRDRSLAARVDATCNAP